MILSAIPLNRVLPEKPFTALSPTFKIETEALFCSEEQGTI